jgi:cell shape-determining protein MreC
MVFGEKVYCETCARRIQECWGSSCPAEIRRQKNLVQENKFLDGTLDEKPPLNDTERRLQELLVEVKALRKENIRLKDELEWKNRINKAG